jgi:hypothetical protein
MSSADSRRETETMLTPAFTQALGVRRTMRLRRVMKKTGLPPEALLDLALEILDISSRTLSVEPIRRTAVGLATARWRNVSPEERSEIARRAVAARWAKRRPEATSKAGNR